MRERIIKIIIAELERQADVGKPGPYVGQPGPYISETIGGKAYLIDGYVNMETLADAILDNLKELRDV